MRIIQKMMIASSLVVLNCFISGSCMAAVSLNDIKENDLPHIEMTLQVINGAFQHGNRKLLERASTLHFVKSMGFDFLADHLGRNLVNFSHMTMSAIQEFELDGDPGNVLSVTFKKDSEWGAKDPARNHWRVMEAYERYHGRIQECPVRFWEPLSYSNNFIDFFQDANFGFLDSANCTEGTRAANSMLKKSAGFKGRLTKPSNLRLTLKNIVLFNSRSEIEEIIFVTLVNTQVGNRIGGHPRSGWLIDEAGSMSDLFDKSNPDHLYIGWLTGKLKAADLNLQTDNNYPVANIAGFSNSSPNAVGMIGGTSIVGVSSNPKLNVFSRGKQDAPPLATKKLSKSVSANGKNAAPPKIENCQAGTDKISSLAAQASTIPKKTAMQIPAADNRARIGQTNAEAITENKTERPSEEKERSFTDWVWELLLSH